MKSVVPLLVALSITFGTGCSTTGHFRVPDNTSLYVDERPAVVQPDGTVTTRPFFWTEVAGIHYRLEKDGSTVQEGKLRAKFRVVSIFWPPYALIYWPVGFRSDLTYDLINGTQAPAVDARQPAPKSAPASPERP
jgi:hypothetical protein